MKRTVKALPHALVASRKPRGIRALVRTGESWRPMPAGYDVVVVVETPRGLFGAVSTRDGSRHASADLARTWDDARSTLDRRATSA